MLNRFNKVIIVICSLIVFEVGFLSLICLYSKVDFVPKQVVSEPLEISEPVEFNLTSGVVPHHNLALPIIEKFFQAVADQVKPDIVVILSPDHFQVGFNDNKKAFITLKPETRVYKDFSVATDLLAKINKDNIVYNNVAVSLDHGIYNLLPVMEKYLPASKILPFLVPADLTEADVIGLIEDLKNEQRLFVVASTDFSHYLPKSAAQFHDVKSIRVLLDFTVPDFDKLEVDCWQCLYGSRYFAVLKNKGNYKIIDHKNSADFVKNFLAEETTSYFSVIFGADDLIQQKEPKGKTLLFFGDMMFDRGVEAISKKNSLAYPLEKIRPLLKGVDEVVANLEGPVVKNSQNFGGDALTFNFVPEILPVLRQANFSILSLANNHVLNRSRAGFSETQELLTQNNLEYFGDPISCDENSIFIKEGIIFIGLNKTFPANCSDQEIGQLIQDLKIKYPADFIIINIHWGNEYQPVNSKSQQNLAHLAIDNGADLIIGHHPHVVQNIEEYKNRLIFYSLGNFIFDQYFSEKTQQGLAIGAELYPDRQIYRIFPFYSKLSQPELMPGENAGKFLDDLANRSSLNLDMQIKNGIIEITN